MNLESYIEDIKSHFVLGSGCTYNSKTWQGLDENHKLLVADYLDRYISRRDVIDSFKDYYEKRDNFLRPFLLTMIWGFEDTGYGTFRTNKYLKKPGNQKVIKDSFDAVAKVDLENAFKQLMSIEGLGVSYVSKLLYFASRAANIREYMLIFDFRVANALVMLADPEIFGLVIIHPSNKYINYKKYCTMVHQLARKYKLEADSIEYFLFRKGGE